MIDDVLLGQRTQPIERDVLGHRVGQREGFDRADRVGHRFVEQRLDARGAHHGEHGIDVGGGGADVAPDELARLEQLVE